MKGRSMRTALLNLVFDVGEILQLVAFFAILLSCDHLEVTLNG